MALSDRNEGAMTALVDSVAGDLIEGYAEMDKFAQYRMKESLLTVIDACIRVLDAEPHRPKRGDEVEAWIKRKRDEGMGPWWSTLDDMLDDYRLHADTGTPLDEEFPETE